jgi:hypothetical protein
LIAFVLIPIALGTFATEMLVMQILVRLEMQPAVGATGTATAKINYTPKGTSTQVSRTILWQQPSSATLLASLSNNVGGDYSSVSVPLNLKGGTGLTVTTTYTGTISCNINLDPQVG